MMLPAVSMPSEGRPTPGPRLRRLLVLTPLEAQASPAEVFDLVNRCSHDSPLTAVLLQVVTLNLLAAENRIYEELASETHARLQELARRLLSPHITALTRVRFGQPAPEILAQTRADQPDLILLPAPRPDFTHRLALPWRRPSRATVSSLARQLIGQAPCAVLVVPVPMSAPAETAVRP